MNRSYVYFKIELLPCQYCNIFLLYLLNNFLYGEEMALAIVIEKYIGVPMEMII